MTSREIAALRTRLTLAVDDAVIDYLRIQKQQTEIIKETPSGIPLPDSQLRIVQASEEVPAAFERYRQANARLRAFLDYGTAPEDILRS